MMEFLPWIGSIVTIFVCSFAIREGGRDEAYGALIFLIGSMTTLAFVLLFGAAWTSPELGLIAIDLMVMLAMIHLVIVTDRFWPLWFAAFQLVSLAVHAATFVAADIIPWVFATGVVFWGWPTKLALVLGVFEYRAQREHAQLVHAPLAR